MKKDKIKFEDIFEKGIEERIDNINEKLSKSIELLKHLDSMVFKKPFQSGGIIFNEKSNYKFTDTLNEITRSLRESKIFNYGDYVEGIYEETNQRIKCIYLENGIITEDEQIFFYNSKPFIPKRKLNESEIEIIDSALYDSGFVFIKRKLELVKFNK